MTKRPTFEAFKAEALNDPEIRAEYDAFEDDYQLKRRMISMRKAAGLTQEQMAEKLGTKKARFHGLKVSAVTIHCVWQRLKTMPGHWAMPLK